MGGTVTSVSRNAVRSIRKPCAPSIRLVAGEGVEGDVHSGATVKHRSRMVRNPAQPNLRQVHLIHAELHEELRSRGFTVSAGEMGENVTTRGVDLLALPAGTRLHLGDSAIVEVTGLRNPCVQLDGLHKGLMKAVLGRDKHGNLIRKTGVMSIVIADGEVKAGDPVRITLPAAPYRPLEVV